MASSLELAHNYFKTGNKCFGTREIELAIENFQMACAIFLENDDTTMYVRSMADLAIAYSMDGHTAAMIQTIMTGMDFCDSRGLKGAKHLFYTTICDKYMSHHDYDTAINYGLMAIQEIEDNPTSEMVTPEVQVLSYLNICNCYCHVLMTAEAEEYLKKGREFSAEHGLHAHDFSFDVLEAIIQAAEGHPDFIKTHKEQYESYVKSSSLTMTDYIQDVQNIVKLFCKLKMYDDALQMVKNLEYIAMSDDTDKLKLEIAKFYMEIYTQNGDKEKYNQACVAYAESDINQHRIELEKELMHMDTTIALSIAGSAFNMI